MARIHVESSGENTYRVTVSGGRTTTHTVTVSPGYREKLGAGDVPVEALVEKSFEFLLERESNTMILSSFDLPVIQSYFPEYESTIGELATIQPAGRIT